MANSNPRAILKLDAQHSRAHSDWHSATRQAKRDVVRMGWARHVLAEESTHPSSHSPARIRRAQNIVASLQNKQA